MSHRLEGRGRPVVVVLGMASGRCALNPVPSAPQGQRAPLPVRAQQAGEARTAPHRLRCGRMQGDGSQ